MWWKDSLQTNPLLCICTGTHGITSYNVYTCNLFSYLTTIIYPSYKPYPYSNKPVKLLPMGNNPKLRQLGISYGWLIRQFCLKAEGKINIFLIFQLCTYIKYEPLTNRFKPLTIQVLWNIASIASASNKIISGWHTTWSWWYYSYWYSQGSTPPTIWRYLPTYSVMWHFKEGPINVTQTQHQCLTSLLPTLSVLTY